MALAYFSAVAPSKLATSAKCPASFAMSTFMRGLLTRVTHRRNLKGALA